MPSVKGITATIPNLDIVLSCPLDGLVLTALRNVKGLIGDDTTEDLRVGGHIHISSDSIITCLNGHQWKAGEFILERVG